MAFCKQCGKQNLDTAKFCTGCGNVLALNQPAKTSVHTNEKFGQPLTERSKNRKKIFLIAGIIFLAATGFAAYFLFFNKKKEFPVMLVLPESLKLRSSMSETGEDNVVRSASYGTRVKVIDSVNGWYMVETDGQKGYMHSRYLMPPKDFYEMDAILKSPGSDFIATTGAVTESRFKKSLIRYFRNQNYTATIPSDIKEKYFKNAGLSGKEIWSIKSNSENGHTVLKGKFTLSNKKGIAIIINNNMAPEKQKLIIFTYDDAENETGVYEFDETEILSLWLGDKENLDYTTINGNTISPGLDIVHGYLRGTIHGMGCPFYFFRNDRMEKDVTPYLEEEGIPLK